MRGIVAAAAGLLMVAAPGIASAGTVTPAQYAYGGGSNANAVINTRPPSASAGGQVRTPAPGTGRGGAGVGPNGRGSAKPGPAPPQPLVGVAASTATPVASFAALNRSIPVDALWAVALAIACALGAWLLRRGKGAG